MFSLPSQSSGYWWQRQGLGCVLNHWLPIPCNACCCCWCRRMALLAAGDLAVLLAFAAVGRHSHGEPLTVSDTFNTALPFILGGCACWRTVFWYLVAGLC